MKNTKPNADGMYWKDGQIHFKTSPWVYVLMIPAMIATYLVLIWAAVVSIGFFLKWFSSFLSIG